MVVKLRGGVMSANESETTVVPIESDMRVLLRAKRAGLSDVGKETGEDYCAPVSQISGQSVHEIDHLIAGLQGARQKLNNDRDRLHREIVQRCLAGR